MTVASDTSAAARPPAQVIVRLEIPEELYVHFEAQGVLASQPPEAVMAQHLERTRDYTAKNGMYLNDAEMTAVRKILGGRTNTPAKLIDVLGRMSAWRAGGWRIDLSPALQEQIHEYAAAAGRPVAQIAPELLLNAVRRYFQTE